METVSENTQVEKKRGRPRKFDYTQLDDIGQKLGPKTRRGQQNLDYAYMAFEVLKMAAGESPEAKERLQPILDKPRPTVLAELGRMMEAETDPETFWLCAKLAAANTHEPARKLAALIKRYRLGESSESLRTMRLYDALLRTIDEHLSRYPETEAQEVYAALEVAGDGIKRRALQGSILPE